MTQKKKFLSGEGDQWFKRNQNTIASKDFSQDLIVKELIDLVDLKNDDSLFKNGGRVCLLEIGCGEGSRLSYLQNNFDIECFGIEPSKKAVEKANSKEIQARIGTADNLEFDDGMFDVVVYGFCLYLCDREDLFQIAKETDRVLKDKGFIVILDFFSPSRNRKNKYTHQDGIYSYKMDYRNLFNWHPFYICYKHKVMHLSQLMYTDEMDEWIAVSVLRKNIQFIDE